MRVLYKSTTGGILVMLCLLTLIVSSCNLFGGDVPPRKPVKAPPARQTYTLPEVAVPDSYTLDPALAHDPASIRAVQMLFTGLVQPDDTLQIRAQLAQSWQQGTDGVTWTFHLKPRVKFSDGSALTSADVAYSLDRALQPVTQSKDAPLYLDLLKDSDKLITGALPTLIGDSIQTPDPTTVVLITRKPATYFLAMLSAPCTFVVEKRLATTYGSSFANHLSEGGGAGPFKLASYSRGTSIVFVPNSNYYDPGPQLQKVTFVFYRSAADTYRAYQSGQVDMTSIALSTLANDRQRPDFHQVPQLWLNYYTMNYLTKPFDNIHIRQAFALALNKSEIVHTIWQDTALATNAIIPKGMPGYNAHLTGPDNTQNLTGNAARARALLQQGMREEGWSSVAQMPAITLTYASDQLNATKEAQAVVKMWQQKLNVNVSLQAVSYDTLLDKVTASTGNANGLQCWSLSWVGEYADEQDWLSRQFGPGVPNNNLNYGQNSGSVAGAQQTLQQQLATADANFNEAERLRSYQQAEQQLVTEAAWIPLEQIVSVFLRTNSIVGVVDNGLNVSPPDDWNRIYRVE